MVSVSLKDLDVDALLALRADVEKMLVEKSRDLERQLARLGEGRGMAGGKRRGRPPAGSGANKCYEGRKNCAEVPGPGGDTWAGRGATPRWLTALLKEGHSIEEFLIGASRKGKSAAGKKPAVKQKGRKPMAKTPGRERKAENARPAGGD